MDFFERQRLVRRICSRKLYAIIPYQNSPISVVFHDPSLDILTQADNIYKIHYDEYKRDNCLTLEETYEILKRDGRWSDKMAEEITKIEGDLKYLGEELNRNQYRKAAQKAIKKTIEEKRGRMNDLWHTKNQLLTSTIEYLANLKKQRFIIGEIIQFTREEDKHLLKIPNFLHHCGVYYNEESGISESQIRELARSDPWRLYWSAAKDLGNQLFTCPLVEISDYQYNLVLWSKIYDFSYESQNRPSDDVINDDELFSGWYQNEVKNREKENNTVDHGSANEIFVIADKEGAADVYGLNSTTNRAKIASRQKTITDKGTVKEAEFEDVQMELRLRANQIVNKGI